jgi:hypothetical protein
MKYQVYIHDPEHKVVFNSAGEYVAIAGGEFSDEYYKRKIITQLLYYWEKDLTETWHNSSFVKEFEQMKLIPQNKYVCWNNIHYFLRKQLYLNFFENLTEHILDQLYQDLQDHDNILILREDDARFEMFQKNYGTIAGGCDSHGLCHDCEELTHFIDVDEYYNENMYDSHEDPYQSIECECKV